MSGFFVSYLRKLVNISKYLVNRIKYLSNYWLTDNRRRKKWQERGQGVREIKGLRRKVCEKTWWKDVESGGRGAPAGPSSFSKTKIHKIRKNKLCAPVIQISTGQFVGHEMFHCVPLCFAGVHMASLIAS